MANILHCLPIMMAAILAVHAQDYDDWIKTAHNIGDTVTMNCSKYIFQHYTCT